MRPAASRPASKDLQAEQSVACNVLHAAPARLARWLLMTQDRVGRANLPLTQEYLATMLGVQRTTVNMIALKNGGLIQYSRGTITVQDRAGLERAACECYDLNRRRQDVFDEHQN